MKCSAGIYLSDDAVCKAYQAAFMLGNLDNDPQSKSKEVSELMTHYSRHIIGEMTSVIFSHLVDGGAAAAAAGATSASAKSDMADTSAANGVGAVAAAAAVGSDQPDATATGSMQEGADAGPQNGNAGDHATVEPSSSSYGHGLPSALEVLSFLVDLISRKNTDGSSNGSSMAPLDDEFAVFGLQMVHRALLAGGSALAAHDALLTLIHRDLFGAITTAVCFR